MRAADLAVKDYRTLANSLMDGASDPATVSFEIQWSEAGKPAHVADPSQGFGGDFAETTATIAWSAQLSGFSFSSDAATTSKTNFASVGHERNGVFFPDVLQDHASGNVVGQSGGAFAYYQLPKPGGAPVTLTLTYSPFDAPQAHAVGLNAYQQGKQLGASTGKATGLGDATNSNVARLRITPTPGSPVLLQVFNYGSHTVGYTLTLS